MFGTCGANRRVTYWCPWETIVENDHWWLPPTKSHRLVIKRPKLARLQSSLKLDGYRGNAATQRAVQTDHYYYFKINRVFFWASLVGGQGCVTRVSQMLNCNYFSPLLLCDLRWASAWGEMYCCLWGFRNLQSGFVSLPHRLQGDRASCCFSNTKKPYCIFDIQH